MLNLGKEHINVMCAIFIFATFFKFDIICKKIFKNVNGKVTVRNNF